MKNYQVLIFSILLFIGLDAPSQSLNKTHREQLISNNEVSVWKTSIYPSNNQKLPLHRHEKNRVVIALSSGKLKITSNLGKTHFLNLEKGSAYFLKKDPPNELHFDENLSKNPIKVIVIELN